MYSWHCVHRHCWISSLTGAGELGERIAIDGKSCWQRQSGLRFEDDACPAGWVDAVGISAGQICSEKTAKSTLPRLLNALNLKGPSLPSMPWGARPG
ncbi:MAG: hypothetical protein R3F19_27875 [Verrucomicrobiales bacterium]